MLHMQIEAECAKANAARLCEVLVDFVAHFCIKESVRAKY